MYQNIINDRTIFVLMLILFMHIIGDWIIQTDKLANLKQKKNWEKYGDNYKDDYKIVLLTHCYSWAFVTFLPLLLINHSIIVWKFWVLINMIIHYFIDDYKANKLKINLVQDQILHMIQIFITWIFYIIFSQITI